MQDRWYKNAVIYEIDVRSFSDSDGDGQGDLRGLIQRLDYLSALGVTCLWLLPIFPSPWRDNGYDVTDHYGIHPDIGTSGDFVELVYRAGTRGMRVVIDMVLNHTSNEHPWFKLARRGDARYRDFYVWSDERPADADEGTVFPGVQETTWTHDEDAGAWYFHRFYHFQPDLNIDNAVVREEMRRILGYWIQQGVAGFRIDAVPFLIEPAGSRGAHPGPDFQHLKDMRAFLQWRRGDAVLLGEANVERDRIDHYFGIGGMHMLFNFPLNQRLWLALATGRAAPIAEALDHTAGIPTTDQWTTFLRNHDEVDLGRLSEEERDRTFSALGPRPEMQLYHRGIRRRTAPMLGGDRRRMELAFSLLFGLPGTPVLYYGDEIGMGDDLSLREREAVRTPMQWSRERNAGFSTAPEDRLVRPVIREGPYAFERVNVADQLRDERSFLNWMKRLILIRRECPEFGLGTWSVLDTDNPHVFGLRAELDGSVVVAAHNVSDAPQNATLGLRREQREHLMDVLGDHDYGDDPSDPFELEALGYRWVRLSGPV